MRGFRGPAARPQANTGDPKVDRALRELGEPAALAPRLFYDKNGRLDVSPLFLKRIDAIEALLASLGGDQATIVLALREEIAARVSGSTTPVVIGGLGHPLIMARGVFGGPF